MINRPDTRAQRYKRHKRVRGKVSGTPECPRLNVFRSEKNIYAQIIDDVNGVTLCSASSVEKDFEGLGSNKEAVRLSGVNVRKWQMLAYVICGTLVGIAAIFFVSAYTTVQPGLGDTYNNEAIASCVMGGTSMAGGLASIGGTVIGVFVISLLQEGIMALRMTKEVQMIITGLIVIVFVYADVSARRRKN